MDRVSYRNATLAIRSLMGVLIGLAVGAVAATVGAVAVVGYLALALWLVAGVIWWAWG